MKIKNTLQYIGAALFVACIAAIISCAVSLAKMATPDVLWLGMACDADAHYQGFESEFDCERFYRAQPESYAWGITPSEIDMSIIFGGFAFVCILFGFVIWAKDL